MTHRFRSLWVLAGLVGLLGLWLAAWAVWGQSLVPPPWLVLPAAADLLLRPEFWLQVGLTCLRALAGFTAGALAGLALGLLMGRSRSADAALFVPAILLQASPPLLWIIPLILVLGTDGWAALAVVFLVVLPLAVFAVREARRAIPAALWDVFAIYGPRRDLVLFELLVPQLTPALRSVLILGPVLALKSTILAEWFGARDGLGRLINQNYATFEMPAFYALSLLFLLLAWATAAGSEVLARRLLPLRRSTPVPAGLIAPAPLPPLATSPAPDQGFVLDQVAFGFPGRPIFRQFSLTLPPASVTVLTGQSGLGKTTLARLALGLLTPHAGLARRPSRPAFLFQDDGLLAHRDCLGNVLLPARWLGLPRAAEQGLAVLEQVGLAGCAGLFPDELSGGMKKRLALARALLLQPDGLILDEPFHNLHPAARTELWDLTWNLLVSRGLPTLIITHYPEELSGRPGLRVVDLANLLVEVPTKL